MAAPPGESNNPRMLRQLVRIRVCSVLDHALDEEPVGYEGRDSGIIDWTPAAPTSGCARPEGPERTTADARRCALPRRGRLFDRTSGGQPFRPTTVEAIGFHALSAEKRHGFVGEEAKATSAVGHNWPVPPEGL